MIYLDNAATSGVKPSGVIAATASALKYYSANPGRSGYKTSIEASLRVYKTRAKLSDFFVAEGPESVAFTLNCTHAINCILKGKLSRGDHVIISDLEHNAVVRPLYSLIKQKGVEVSVAETSLNDDVTVLNFEKLIKPNTRMIFCTHASNVTGQILPIKRIGEMAESKGIAFAVDAAQTAGVLPINMQEMNIDYLAVAAHKGLYSPMGIGVLIAREPLEHTVLEGGTGSNSIDPSQPVDMPERVESGTVNLPGIFGLSAGVDFVKFRGADNIYRHEFGLIKYLYEALKRSNRVILYTSTPELYRCVPVLSFNVADKTSEEVAAILAEKNIAVRAGLQCAPTAHKKIGTLPFGAVRVSTGAFNNKAEIDRLIEIVKKI